ncbi:MAG: hypothetical protein JWN24_1442 [Phycisphaerales bacterium]|nr:hypothetical protein [Phycisphaerales bacterium]
MLLEAMARGDDAETVRLRRSCLRKTYSGPDAAFEKQRPNTVRHCAECGTGDSLMSRDGDWLDRPEVKRIRTPSVAAPVKRQIEL